MVIYLRSNFFVEWVLLSETCLEKISVGPPHWSRHLSIDPTVYNIMRIPCIYIILSMMYCFYFFLVRLNSIWICDGTYTLARINHIWWWRYGLRRRYCTPGSYQAPCHAVAVIHTCNTIAPLTSILFCPFSVHWVWFRIYIFASTPPSS